MTAYILAKLFVLLGWIVFPGEGQTPAEYVSEHPCTVIIWHKDEDAGWVSYIPELPFLSDPEFGETLSPSRTYWARCRGDIT